VRAPSHTMHGATTSVGTGCCPAMRRRAVAALLHAHGWHVPESHLELRTLNADRLLSPTESHTTLPRHNNTEQQAAARALSTACCALHAPCAAACAGACSRGAGSAGRCDGLQQRLARAEQMCCTSPHPSKSSAITRLPAAAWVLRVMHGTAHTGDAKGGGARGHTRSAH
jgi:hypothetical protein